MRRCRLPETALPPAALRSLLAGNARVARALAAPADPPRELLRRRGVRMLHAELPPGNDGVRLYYLKNNMQPQPLTFL